MTTPTCWSNLAPLRTVDGSTGGLEPLHKFEHNEDVDSSGGPAEDIWEEGGLWVAPTSAQVHNLVSTDAADAAAGAGVRSMLVEGLDASWEQQSEIVALDGLTPVATSGSYIRINRMLGVTFGSSETSAGGVTATADSDGTITASTSPGHAQTLQAIYTVPAGHSFSLTRLDAYLNKNSGGAPDIQIFLYARPNADLATRGWLVKWQGGLSFHGSSHTWSSWDPGVPYAAKTDIKITADEGSSDNLNVSAKFDGVLEAL